MTVGDGAPTVETADAGQRGPYENGLEPGAARKPEEGVDAQQPAAEGGTVGVIAKVPAPPVFAPASAPGAGRTILPGTGHDDAGEHQKQPGRGVDDAGRRPKSFRIPFEVKVV